MAKREPSPGKVVLIGAGPGDPDLLTLKAVRYLRQADVVVYDYLTNEEMLTYCKPEAEKIYVGKRSGIHTLPQNEINRLLIEKAQTKGLVVRLKGGDPFIFGRGGEEVLALFEAGIEFEVVPGITAGSAALSYAGIPATHRNDATSVTFVTGHEDPTKPGSGINWQALAKIQGTLVFYMGVHNLSTITKNLLHHGKNPGTPVAMIQWGTLPRQKTITGELNRIATLANQMGFQPPALIVIGEVVRHRDRMNWYEKKPLFGKSIVITRARAQGSNLESTLRELGAEVISFPTIRIESPESWQALDQAISSLNRFHWIVFTSVNGVESFFTRLFDLGYDARHLKGLQIAAIGPATADRLRRFGLLPDLQPQEYVSESLIEELIEKTTLSEKRFLLPRAAESRPLLVQALTKVGAIVEEIPVYRTVLETESKQRFLDRMQVGRIDLITFTSSSTVKNFVSLLNEEHLARARKIPVACIGPITRKTTEEQGFTCHVMPVEYTISGLVKAIVSYYKQNTME